jgi:phosphoketolase
VKTFTVFLIYDKIYGGIAMSDTMNISPELLEKMNRYWEAANYLSAGQLYLLDNPLLREPLTMDHVKKKIVGHWGTVPGQNFIYVHLNRVIKKYDLDMIYISGPGHGGNFMVAGLFKAMQVIFNFSVVVKTLATYYYSKEKRERTNS